MAKISLFLDEDVHMALGAALRKRGFDVVHAQEVKRKGRTDAEQLAHAVSREQCVLTFNVKDFVKLHNEYAHQEKEHWGILLSKQRPIGETFRAVLKILQKFSKESIKNRIVFI
mgnify:CR=1 FL=1